MKKTLKIKMILLALLSAVILLPVTAQTSSETSESEKPIWDHGDNVSKISYTNVRIYRVLEAEDAYVILYEKQGLKTGTVSIPKKWGTMVPRKLELRKCPKTVPPYMTILYKEGSFYKVWLTLPVSKLDSVWGIAPNGYDTGDTEKETLDIEL